MCSVKVLLLPVGDVGGALRGAPLGRRGVCRKLFSSEGAAPRDVLRAAEEKLWAEGRARWNFDFEKGVPLPGRFQWVAVGEKPQEEQPSKETKSSSAIQSKITDFLTKRKRSGEASPQLKKIPRTEASNKGSTRVR